MFESKTDTSRKHNDPVIFIHAWGDVPDIVNVLYATCDRMDIEMSILEPRQMGSTLEHTSAIAGFNVLTAQESLHEGFHPGTKFGTIKITKVREKRLLTVIYPEGMRDDHIPISLIGLLFNLAVQFIQDLEAMGMV